MLLWEVVLIVLLTVSFSIAVLNPRCRSCCLGFGLGVHGFGFWGCVLWFLVWRRFECSGRVLGARAAGLLGLHNERLCEGLRVGVWDL